MDDAVYGLVEDAACFEQQETETVDNLGLPRNAVFEACDCLRMRSLLTVQFGLVLGFQFHQFTVVISLYTFPEVLERLYGKSVVYFQLLCP